jgi:hypothetical protein
MQAFAFAPERFDEVTNLDILLFVPDDAETWSDDEEGAGYVARNRTTGQLTAVSPHRPLPNFSEQDIENARLAALDLQ